ncbi:hypothetical protein Q9966_005977 [Columba livia]|nr:hypothetical protein Q9966_005977 [Columba livia]
MAPSPTQPCHHQHAPSFPDTLLNTPRSQQPTAALTILQHLLQILSSNSIPQHWHNQAREHLLNSLHHHSQQLQQCLTPNRMLFRTQGPRNLLLTIHKYFGDIQDFLRTHNHSACAWDHVRLQAHICFQYMDQLLGQAREHLLNSLHHHSQQLQQCLTPNRMLFRTQGPRNLLLTIDKYFGDIQDFLRTHNHSACAWDHVRLQAHDCFQHLHNLTSTTPN